MKQHKTTLILSILFLSALAWQQITLISASSISAAGENSFVFSPNGKLLAKISYLDNNTHVSIHKTDDMSVAASWRIPDFHLQDLQFSPIGSGKILITDNHRILIYELIGNKQKLKFIQPELKNRRIVQIGFTANSDDVLWATEKTVYKTNPSDRKSIELAHTRPLQSSISSFTSLNNDELAVSLKNNSDIFIYSPNSSDVPNVLKGHTSSVFGVLSPAGEFLFSVDNNQELIIWDADNKKILRRLKLGEGKKYAMLTRFATDPQKKNVVISSRFGDQETNRQYLADDLKNGRIRPFKMNNTQRFPESAVPADQPGHIDPSNFLSSPSKKPAANAGRNIESEPTESIAKKQQKRNTLFDLAKIEADNGNFDAALDFIKMVPLNDPNFKQSRELRKKVYEQIEIRNSLNAARDRLQTGNLNSARVLLENMQTEYPDDPEVNRYLGVVKQKLTKILWIKILVITVFIILLFLLGLLIWRYRADVRKALKKAASAKKEREETNKKVNPERKEFILLLNKVKNQLKLANLQDREKKHLDEWLNLTARINMIEKKAKLDDKYLAELTDRLIEIQSEITNLSGVKSAQSNRREETSQKAKRQKTKRTGQERTSQKQSNKTASSEKKTPPNYYQILGISQKATIDQVKKAYREKMKEYHPDKHSSSDFDWIKSEASRMTKLIQEAYETLSDPEKRKTYSP